MVKPNSKNSILLVIDVVNFCCESKHHKKIRTMVQKLVPFITKFKKRIGGSLIYVNCTRWDKKHLPDNLNELYKNPRATYYTTDKTGHSEKFYKLQPEKEDIIITKNSYDAFVNPSLDKILKKKKIKYLIITGIYGDGCVHATIQGGFSKNYHFIILKDLIETTDQPRRQKFQNTFKRYTWPIMFGKTINAKDLFTLLK
ncbi:hypothetical protein CMO92_00020 [Candidatus Woesearchaeota archaeon]|nr:hypothetical protein [Candidatus Woesearchaeota archaeon]